MHRFRPPTLHSVAGQGQEHLVVQYLDDGQDVNVRDDRDRTPLHHAAECGQLHVARVLLQRGADIELIDDFGATPLYRAAASEARLEMVKLLIDEGHADENAAARNGWTPLMIAALSSAPRVCKLLLERGAYIGAGNCQGGTAIDMADDEATIHVLQLYGGLRQARVIFIGLSVGAPREDGQAFVHNALTRAAAHPLFDVHMIGLVTSFLTGREPGFMKPMANMGGGGQG